MNNQITVEIKSVYGNDTIYPVCDTAKFFARLAGTKTLTKGTINLIKAQGYVVIAQQPAVEL